MSWLSDIFKGVGSFFTNLFKAPKVTLPTIDLSALKKREIAPTPVVKPVSKVHPRPRMDISSFQDLGVNPRLQAILGLNIPPVSPGLLIPGGTNNGGQ